MQIHDQVLPIDLLRQGFLFNGEHIPLLSLKGIIKPKLMGLPHTITTALKIKYNDSIDESDYLKYKYRGDDIHHRDNVDL